MLKPRHIFLSQNATMLPRWQEAFPAAQASTLESMDTVPDGSSLAWLRLHAGEEAAARIAALRERAPGIPFVVMADIPNDVAAIAAFSAGARGYCNSHAMPELLQQIAEVVLQGGLWIGEGLMQQLLKLVNDLPSAAPETRNDWAQTLTDREREVALAIADGGSNREIARQMNITERTVKAHVGTILNKLQVRDRLQLALLIQGRTHRS